MAKKGKNSRKNKKQRKKKNYNQKEFCDIFCQTCLICKRLAPTFCYNYLYKTDDKAFVNKVFNNLVDIHAIYDASVRPMSSLSIEQFQNVICRTGVCFNGDVFASASCDSIKSCYNDFQVQMGMAESSGIIHEIGTDVIKFKNNESKKNVISYKKKKKKRKNRYVCQSYPSFFCRNDDTFKATVRRILYGDSDNEQDPDQELSTGDTREASGHLEGGKS